MRQSLGGDLSCPGLRPAMGLRLGCKWHVQQRTTPPQRHTTVPRSVGSQESLTTRSSVDPSGCVSQTRAHRLQSPSSAHCSSLGSHSVFHEPGFSTIRLTASGTGKGQSSRPRTNDPPPCDFGSQSNSSLAPAPRAPRRTTSTNPSRNVSVVPPQACHRSCQSRRRPFTSRALPL